MRERREEVTVRMINDLARAVRHALLVLTAVAAAGCGIGSVSSLISDTDVQFDSLLVGAWQESGGKESAVITTVESGRYSIVYTDSEGKIGRFQAILGRVGAFRVLDVEPEDPAPEATALYRSLLLPLHGAVFIDSVGAELRFRLLEPDSLKQYLQREPNAVTHVMRDEVVVLTAPTADVQRFLVRYVPRAGALGEPNAWVRRSP